MKFPTIKYLLLISFIISSILGCELKHDTRDVVPLPGVTSIEEATDIGNFIINLGLIDSLKKEFPEFSH